MTLSDLEWLSQIFNNRKHRAVSLRQLSLLSINLISRTLCLYCSYFLKHNYRIVGRGFQCFTGRFEDWDATFVLRSITRLCPACSLDYCRVQKALPLVCYVQYYQRWRTRWLHSSQYSSLLTSSLPSFWSCVAADWGSSSSSNSSRLKRSPKNHWKINPTYRILTISCIPSMYHRMYTPSSFVVNFYLANTRAKAIGLHF